MLSSQHYGFKKWQTRFSILILFSNLQWYMSSGEWQGFCIFHIFSSAKVWVDPSSGETKWLTIPFHGNQVCAPLPLAHFLGSKWWDKDGTSSSTKHERKTFGATVAGSYRDSGSSFCSCCILYTNQEELGFYTTFSHPCFEEQNKSALMGAIIVRIHFGLFVFDPK